MTTDRQKDLQEAKDLYNELRCEYEAYLWDLED